MVDPTTDKITLIDFSTALIIGPGGFIEAGQPRMFPAMFCAPEACLDRRYSFNADTWVLGQSFTSIMRKDAINTGEEVENKSVAEVYTEMMRKEVAIQVPDGFYGGDMQELIGWMMDYDALKRP